MKNFIVLKFDPLAVSLISVIYGINLIVFPDLVDYGEVYQVVNEIFNSFTFGTIFIILGSCLVIGTLLGCPKFRAFSLSTLVSIWTLFLFTVIFSGVPNTVWILSLAMVIFSFGVVVKEWFH